MLRDALAIIGLKLSQPFVATSQSTMRAASPIRAASSAPTVRPVKQISRALWRPTKRLMRWEPPPFTIKVSSAVNKAAQEGILILRQPAWRGRLVERLVAEARRIHTAKHVMKLDILIKRNASKQHNTIVAWTKRTTAIMVFEGVDAAPPPDKRQRKHLSPSSWQEENPDRKIENWKNQCKKHRRGK